MEILVSDMYEYRYNGTHFRIRLSCKHEYKFYDDTYSGTHLIEPIIPTLVEMVPNGVRRNLRNGFHNGLQDFVDARAAVGGIMCPQCTYDVNFDESIKFKFRAITHSWEDADYDKLNPYTKAMAYCFKGDDSE